jgi:pyrimidine deaminase RibD-like protein
MADFDSMHRRYLTECLQLATQSPPKPTNFRVGALLLIRCPTVAPDGHSPAFRDRVISTGYTLELPGNTHAEQSCLKKLASRYNVYEERVGQAIKRECESEDEAETAQVVMYVTMEPCGKRLSGNAPCVERIIQAGQPEGGVAGRGIDMVYFGVKEPAIFVGQSQGCKMLDDAGIKWEHVGGMEDEILKVATEGHKQAGNDGDDEEIQEATNIDDISEEERRRQEQMPRNPKKRMMEV